MNFRGIHEFYGFSKENAGRILEEIITDISEGIPGIIAKEITR